MATPKLQISAEEYRAIRDGSMTEAEWRANVNQLLAHHGWEILLQIPDNAYRALSQAGKTDKRLVETLMAIRGFPDLLVGNRRLGQHMFIELKKMGGKPTDSQREKFPILWGCGMSGGYWQPDERDALEELLIVGIK